MIPGLYASTPEPLGFGPSLEIRAFLFPAVSGTSLRPRSTTSSTVSRRLGSAAALLVEDASYVASVLGRICALIIQQVPYYRDHGKIDNLADLEVEPSRTSRSPFAWP